MCSAPWQDREREQKRFIRQAFSRYISPDVVDQLLANPEILSLGGERLEISCVFTDLAALTPGPYLHLGGDEALGSDPARYASLVARGPASLTGLGKTPVAWHEAGAADHLAAGTIGQYWGFTTPVDGSAETIRSFVARGGRIILSPADAVYLDMKPDADFPLGLTWANGPTSGKPTAAKTSQYVCPVANVTQIMNQPMAT